jgi:photosystem II stability/assembly factor-like uncharacterized protein
MEGTMAYSVDGGHNWQPFSAGAQPAGGGRRGGGAGSGRVILSADGSVFMSTSGTPRISTDKGTTWKEVVGLPTGLSPVADRANPAKFYALDMAQHLMYLSTDGGATFTTTNEVTGLPAAGGGGGRGGRGGGGLVAVGGREGDLWIVGRSLCHSTDGGKTFKEVPNHPPISQMSFGKAAPGKDYPAIYVANEDQSGGPQAGLYRSDDEGATWVRINDAQHQWGNRFRCISGDPRIYGRVYFGTDGRGAFYGDIAN